jgi:hypothetical protein
VVETDIVPAKYRVATEELGNYVRVYYSKSPRVWHPLLIVHLPLLMTSGKWSPSLWVFVP